MQQRLSIQHLTLLTPPYTSLVRLDGAAPPLGAVLVVDLACGVPAVEAAVAAYRAAPWCPVCLQLPATPDPNLFVATRRLPPWVAALHPAVPPAPADVVQAVLARLSPTASYLATYVADRIDRPEAVVLLEPCFGVADNAASADPASDTLRRRVKKLGPLLPRDWAAVANTTQVLRYARRHQLRSLERAANDCGIDPRTLRSRLHHLAGVGYREALELVGWEWFLEVVLRKHGCVSLDGSPPEPGGIR